MFLKRPDLRERILKIKEMLRDNETSPFHAGPVSLVLESLRSMEWIWEADTEWTTHNGRKIDFVDTPRATLDHEIRQANRVREWKFLEKRREIFSGIGDTGIDRVATTRLLDKATQIGFTRYHQGMLKAILAGAITTKFFKSKQERRIQKLVGVE